MTDHAERRKSKRYPCDRHYQGAVSLPGKPDTEAFRCHAVNVSAGGLMLETRTPLEVGQKIELYLTSGDRSRSFVAEAEVRWVRPYGEVHRCGVMFLSRREDYIF